MASGTWPSTLVVAPSDFVPGIQLVGEVNSINRLGREQVVKGTMLRTASLNFDVRDEETHHVLQMLVERLEGAANTVKLPWFNYTAKLGSGTGTPLVNGSHLAGTSVLNSQNWTGPDPKLKSGAMIQVGTQPFIYRVIADATGSAPALTLRPRLRFPLAGAEPITYAPDPANGIWLVTTVKLQQSSGEYGRFTAPRIAEGIALSFIEAIRDAY